MAVDYGGRVENGGIKLDGKIYTPAKIKEMSEKEFRCVCLLVASDSEAAFIKRYAPSVKAS